MYGREYGGQDLTFEASGGLIKGTLVMQDRETDSYWPIMAGKSVHGELEGTRMTELATTEKRRWGDWVAAHPDTLVLSVDGREDAPPGYGQYYASEEGFRGLEASDDRLATKTPIYAFRLDDQPVAIPFRAFTGGAEFRVDGRRIHLYRPAGASLFESSRAHLLEGEDCPAPGPESAPECAEPLNGFDTFWYGWSLNNPDTRVLQQTTASRNAGGD